MESRIYLQIEDQESGTTRISGALEAENEAVALAFELLRKAKVIPGSMTYRRMVGPDMGGKHARED